MCTACSFDGYSRFRPDRRQLQHVVVLARVVPQQLVRPLGAEVAGVDTFVNTEMLPGTQSLQKC